LAYPDNREQENEKRRLELALIQLMNGEISDSDDEADRMIQMRAIKRRMSELEATSL
jgi:hypothetical protein